MKTAFVAALAVAASATLPHVIASSEDAPFCAPLPAELVAWGLPAGEATRTVIVNTSRQRTVHPADNSSRAILTVVSSKPTGQNDTREAFDYDETIEQSCLVKRNVEGDFRGILLALALGAPAPKSLIALSQETTVLIATSTERTHRVDLDEHTALSFLLLAGPDATWRDVVNVTDTHRTFRTTISTPADLTAAELIERARVALEGEILGSGAQKRSAADTSSLSPLAPHGELRPGAHPRVRLRPRRVNAHARSSAPFRPGPDRARSILEPSDSSGHGAR